jgi:acyl transferase domain-containing protein/acyl carrier protein
LAAHLKLQPSELGIHEPLSRYGLDSMTAIEITGELEEWLGRKISPTLAWEYPSIQLLAAHLAGAPVDVPSNDPQSQPNAPARQPIAIVGIGCRFPGAKDAEAFWELVAKGVDAIGEVPSDRWDSAAYFDADLQRPGKMNTRWGGFLEAIDQFDAQFFEIAPREAKRMDPQQRLLLEVTWDALADAGETPEKLSGSPTGVFIGISTNDYARMQSEDPSLSDAYAGTGSALSISANRISYLLNLRGPSLAVDTACSSSLVAVHLACRSLWNGESSLALAGGANLILSPLVTVNFSKAGFMSPDGRCKAFDEKANG